MEIYYRFRGWMVAWSNRFKDPTLAETEEDEIEEPSGIDYCLGCGGRINPDYGKCTRCECKTRKEGEEVKREILCQPCGSKRFPHFPGEHQTAKIGNAVDDFLCDRCGAKISQGSVCYASSMSGKMNLSCRFESLTPSSRPMKGKVKLKPCPFCGGKVNFDPNHINPERRFECEGCGVMIMFDVDLSEKEAIAAWNRRAGKEP